MTDQSTAFETILHDRLLVSLMMRSSSHVTELADAFGMSVAGVARAVRRLESDGVIVAERRGRTRRLYLNSRRFAKNEMRALLGLIADARPRPAPALQALSSRRRR
jgi:DNA-binding MarR family transcriptional regulator